MDAQKILTESQSSVKLIKNSRGYGWEIKIYNFDVKQILAEVKTTDNALRKEYAPELDSE